MPYVAQADLGTLIPPEQVIEALDDDGDGLADAGRWGEVAADASEAVDAYLERRYSLPLPEPVPAIVSQAARIFAAEILHQRRGLHGDKNPLTKRADDFRRRLDRIARGEDALSFTAEAGAPPISIVTEPAGTVPRSRLNG